jgi:hypothetical protein
MARQTKGKAVRKGASSPEILAGELVTKENQRRERKRAKAAGDNDQADSDNAQIELGVDEEEMGSRSESA